MHIKEYVEQRLNISKYSDTPDAPVLRLLSILKKIEK